MKNKKRKLRSAQERALFHSGLFGHKVQRDKTKYNRKDYNGKDHLHD